MKVKLNKNIDIAEPKDIKHFLIVQHGSLTNTALNFGIDYNALLHVLGGRRRTKSIISAICRDLNIKESDFLGIYKRK